MKIDEYNCHKLTPIAQVGLFLELLSELREYVETYSGGDEEDEEGVREELLRWLLRALDEADEEDTFGTEGWRRALLGED